MPTTVSEKWDSREGTTGDGTSTDLRYIIRGTDDDSAARDALVTNSPAFYNLLIQQSAHIAWMRCLKKSYGCRLKVKARWRSESCPLGKWPSA